MTWVVVQYEKCGVLNGRLNIWDGHEPDDDQIFVQPPWFWADVDISRGSSTTELCIFAQNSTSFDNWMTEAGFAHTKIRFHQQWT
jgi:hypothetical protein